VRIRVTGKRSQCRTGYGAGTYRADSGKGNIPDCPDNSGLPRPSAMTKAGENYFSGTEHIALVNAVINCTGKYFSQISKKCSENGGDFLLYVEGVLWEHIAVARKEV